MVAPLIPLHTAMAIGAGFGTALLALAYMAAYLFNAQSMRAYAKQELGELAVSAILVMLLIGLVAQPAAFLKTMVPQETPAIPDSALTPAGIQARMYERMEKPLVGLVQSMTVSSMRLSKLVSYNYNYMVGIPYTNPTGSASPGAGGSMLQSALMMGIDSTALNLLLAGSMKIIYVFLSFVSTLLLLPLGIVLRFVPPARQAGTMLIAIGLAVTYVFPIAMFWTTGLMWRPDFANPIPPSAEVESQPDPPGAGLICSTAASVAVTVGEDITAWVITLLACAGPQAAYPPCTPSYTDPLDPPTMGVGIAGWVQEGFYYAKLATAVASSLTLHFSSPTSEQVMEEGFEPLQNLMHIGVARNAAVLFMAVVQLLVSIVMAKNLAQALGAENQLYGLSRMV